MASRDGFVVGVGGPGSRTGRPPGGAGGRLPRHARSGQHPSPPLPEPHPRVPARARRQPVPLAAHALPGLEPAGRGGGVRVGVGRPVRAGPGRLHDDHGPPVRPPAWRWRPDLGRDRRGAGGRAAVPPDPRVDEPGGEGRGAAARLAWCRTTTRSWPTPSAWWSRHHDRARGAMVRVALAPCSPFSVTPELMARTAELAERLDVRLHTHLAEDADEDRVLPRPLRLSTDRALRAGRLGDRTGPGWPIACSRTGTRSPGSAHGGPGVAHCPSSNQLIGAGLAPVRELRTAGVPVGIGLRRLRLHGLRVAVAGERERALLLARLRHGPEAMSARDALEMATLGGAACLGRHGRDRRARTGRRGRPGRLAAHRRRVRRRPSPIRWRPGCAAGRSRRATPSSTGRLVVEDGALVIDGVQEMLARHRRIAREWADAAS